MTPNNDSFWRSTEAGKDLMHYAALLPAKVSRQLRNCWYLENSEDWDRVDYEYTGYVLRESLALLKRAFHEILSMELGSDEQLVLERMQKSLFELEKDILEI